MLDLETTGANPVHDRITEIALVRVEAGHEVARWSTLLNPGTPISPFIQKLTGIRDDMVAEAPEFDAVATQLMALLKDAVLVAHNVRFDHSFLLNEFARLGSTFRIKTMCTVRLSRLLYPQYKSHGLDAIMQRHALKTQARHRAMGDVDVVLAWLALAEQELGAALVGQHAHTLLQGSAALPPQLETDVAEIPDTTGVYLFFGEGALPLYIGKSINLRSRVMSHFQAAGREAREMRIAQEIRRIEWIETAGELGALLLEARLVKERQPVYNRQLRRERTLCAWRLDNNPLARPLLSMVRADDLQPDQFGQLYGVYRSKNQALSSLRELADTHRLCPQALGLESGKGRCFAHQIGRCKGVCCAGEKPDLHYLRLKLALATQQLQAWPHAGKVGLREHNPKNGRSEVHIFDQWCHLATVRDDNELEEALRSQQTLAFDLDTYRLLIKHLMPSAASGVEIIPLSKAT